MKLPCKFFIVCISEIVFARTTSAQLLSGTAKLVYTIDPVKVSPPSHFSILYNNVLTRLCMPTKANITVANSKILVDIWQMPNGTGCPVGTGGIDPTITIRGRTIEIVDDRNTLGNPTNVLKLPLTAWGFGVNSIPFRFRPKVDNSNVQPNAIVTTAFAFATTFGYTWGHGSITTRGITNWTQSANVFFGPSTTGSTTGANTAASTMLGPVQNNFALSFGGAYVLARNNVGLIFAIGWDEAISKNAALWPYQGKLWFGLGISTGILK